MQSELRKELPASQNANYKAEDAVLGALRGYVVKLKCLKYPEEEIRKCAAAG